MGVIVLPAPRRTAAGTAAKVARANGFTTAVARTTRTILQSAASASADQTENHGLKRRQFGTGVDVFVSPPVTTTSPQQNGTAIPGSESMSPLSIPSSTTSQIPSSTTFLAPAASTSAAKDDPLNMAKSSSAQVIGGVVGGIFLVLIVLAFLYGSWQAKKSVGLQRQLILLRQRERAEMRIRSAERGLEREWEAERRAQSRDSNGANGIDGDMRELVGDEDLPRYERCSDEDCPPRYTPPPPLTPLMPSTPERTYQPQEWPHPPPPWSRVDSFDVHRRDAGDDNDEDDDHDVDVDDTHDSEHGRL